MLKQNMESEYGKATVCDFYNQSKCDLALEPGTLNLLRLYLGCSPPNDVMFQILPKSFLPLETQRN